MLATLPGIDMAIAVQRARGWTKATLPASRNKEGTRIGRKLCKRPVVAAPFIEPTLDAVRGAKLDYCAHSRCRVQQRNLSTALQLCSQGRAECMKAVPTSGLQAKQVCLQGPIATPVGTGQATCSTRNPQLHVDAVHALSEGRNVAMVITAAIHPALSRLAFAILSGHLCVLILLLGKPIVSSHSRCHKPSAHAWTRK